MPTTRAVPHVLFILLLTLAASGCELAGGIFKAGFWTAIILVAVVAIGLMLVVTKLKS